MFATGSDAGRPLDHLRLGEYRDPDPPPGWAVVRVKATSLNHHDLWTLRGVTPPGQRLPVVLGSEAAGIDHEGNEVIVYPVINEARTYPGNETLDPRHRVLSESHDGTFAELVTVPRHCLIPKPTHLNFVAAACLPGTWLTAYRMLFTAVRLPPESTVLVQGAGGGVATALVCLGTAVGHRIWVTSRSEIKRENALRRGADAAFATGTRLPRQVDAVMETVGQDTWRHSIQATRPGGSIVVSGATSGAMPAAFLRHIFMKQLSIIGVKLGTRAELEDLVRLCGQTGVYPPLNRVVPLVDARSGFAALARGEVFGKIVFTVGG
nr:zinc-binding dehydrogenase [Phytoactinopolyspora limicola]